MPTTTEMRPALLAGPTDRQLSRLTASSIGPRPADRCDWSAAARAAAGRGSGTEGGVVLRAPGGGCWALAAGATAVDRPPSNRKERGMRIIFGDTLGYAIHDG